MDLRQLEYAVAVAEELHFGRAAERMHVAQQSVSEQIRRLEREVGAPLFHRTSRRVTLTTVGEAFLPQARRALAAAAEALEAGRRAARGLGGELRVGYAEELGQRVFPLALPRLAELAPQVRVVPQPMSTPAQVEALVERRIDVGLGWQPDPPPELATLLIAREPLVVAVAAQHPLAAPGRVDPTRLSHEPLVLVPRSGNPAAHDRTVGQLAAAGAAVVVHQEEPSLDRMLPLVVAGDAVGITVASAAVAHPSPGVVYRSFTDPSPSLEYRLVHRRDATGAAVTALVDVVRRLRDAGAFVPPELPV